MTELGEMTLYQIDEAIRAAIESGCEPVVNEETGEVTYPDGMEALEALQVAKQDKMIASALWIKSGNALLKAMDDEIKSMKARRDAAAVKIGKVESYLSESMQKDGISKLDVPQCTLSFRKSFTTEVDDLEKLPGRFVVEETTYKPMKAEIRKALQNGEDVPGAHLEEHINLQIK